MIVLSHSVNVATHVLVHCMYGWGGGGGGNWGISKLYSQNIEVEQILSEKYLFRLTYNMTYKCAIRIKITE